MTRECKFSLPMALAMLGLCGTAFGQQAGHIQVKCDPGVQIFLDGTFKGVTNADVGGLIIQDVPSGKRRIRAVKTGFAPQETEVTLAAGQVLVYQVRPFVPEVRIRQEGKKADAAIKAKVGTIVIQSLPVDCTIHIPSARFDNVRKSEDKLIADNVPAGAHAARFSAMGKTLRHNVSLEAGATVRLMVNFLSGKVVDQGAEEARARAEEARTGRLGSLVEELAKLAKEEHARWLRAELSRREERARSELQTVLDLAEEGKLPEARTRARLALITYAGTSVEARLRSLVGGQER